MPYAEIDDAGEFVVNEAGERNVIDQLDMGGWDHVRNLIPQDLREEKLWENVKDTQTLLKNYAHAQKRMGGSIKVPDEKAGPEVWEDIYTKLGRPPTSADYKEVFGEMPEGFKWDEGLQQAYLAAAHKAGLSNAQARTIIEAYENYHKDIALNEARITGNIQTELRNKWGANYETNIALASRAVTKLGGEELHEFLDETGLGNHPVLIDTFVKIGRILAEDNVIPGVVSGVATTQQARDKIAQIQADANHPYHKGDDAAVAEMNKLFQIAYPSQG